MDDAGISAPPPFKERHVDRATRVSLSADSLEDFVAWVASIPATKAEEIRDVIAADFDDATLAALASSLNEFPVIDFGRHLMLLAIMGESRHPQAVDVLEEFVWTEADLAPAGSEPTTSDSNIGQASAEDAEHDDGVLVTCGLNLDVSSMLRARAVEMLAYVDTEAAGEATLRVVRDHPDSLVRRSAIDGYLFNRGDDEPARERLLALAHPDDRRYVGAPRRTRDMDPAEFDARVAKMLEGAEPPPPPKNDPRARSPRVATERSHSGSQPAHQ